ncbi:hypothetical protein KM043_002040 [Ampulex compressa]|nr:hypothetical protein KM043_002040 [Ampulex compressa]
MPGLEWKRALILKVVGRSSGREEARFSKAVRWIRGGVGREDKDTGRGRRTVAGQGSGSTAGTTTAEATTMARRKKGASREAKERGWAAYEGDYDNAGRRFGAVKIIRRWPGMATGYFGRSRAR